MTLAVENGELVVARIIHGGMIDRQGMQLHFSVVWFQKISIPPPWRELEIPKGWGERGQWPRKFQRGGGVND